jgi:hypothetical protein
LSNTIVYVNPDTITKFNILVRNNEDTVLTLNCTDENNAPINLTGAVVVMQVKANPSLQGSLLDTFSTTNALIVLNSDPTTGSMVLTIPVARAAEYSWTRGYFDIQITQSDLARIYGEGIMDVVQGITSSS